MRSVKNQSEVPQILVEGMHTIFGHHNPKKFHLIPLNGFKPRFSKLRLATKMDLKDDSSKFSHPKSTQLDEKSYDDPIQIIPLHLGRLLVSKIFTE
jgi:hypothetical protein